MKDKTFKITIFIIGLVSLITLVINSLVTINLLNKYNTNENIIISNIINNIKEEYPNLQEEDIIKTLNEEDLDNSSIVSKYGIELTNESISLANQKITKKIIIYNISILLIFILIIVSIIKAYQLKKAKNIKEILNYLKEINNKNYLLNITTNSEDELSLLKNELYKTAITLNEKERLSKKDKELLKDSLSDISHQIKTPLTSINLMLDNLIENKNLSSKEKDTLLLNIRHKISNINFLIQSLLTLSRFDANAITFKNENIKIRNLLAEAVRNVDAICDLKSIKINIEGSNSISLYCDYKWQVEALTNILKNCLEHSKENSRIDISYTTNDLFTKIVITDYGTGMSEKDLKNIFKRFYKGENSHKDSIGIGLSLAKTIIEKNNGYITVQSELNKGTTFTIKYLK